jgi:hypothetical protein
MSNFRKGTAMSTRSVCIGIAMMFAFTLPVHAGGKDQLQKYFNNVAVEVKAANDPVAKREILHSSLDKMSRALDMAEGSPLLPEEAQGSVSRFRATLQEKRDELDGRNGFVAVSDAQLDNFSDYVVQDMEQALETVHISLISLLLIVIIVILLV